jgi:hypothetical protein
MLAKTFAAAFQFQQRKAVADEEEDHVRCLQPIQRRVAISHGQQCKQRKSVAHEEEKDQVRWSPQSIQRCVAEFMVSPARTRTEWRQRQVKVKKARLVRSVKLRWAGPSQVQWSETTQRQGVSGPVNTTVCRWHQGIVIGGWLLGVKERAL